MEHGGFLLNQLTVLHNNQTDDSLTACYDCTGTASQVSCELNEIPTSVLGTVLRLVQNGSLLPAVVPPTISGPNMGEG